MGVATNLVFDITQAPFAPNASQPHVGFGWTDAQGSTWSTNASSNLVAASTSVSPASLLSRPGSGAGTSAVTPGVQENSLNQRAKLTWTVTSTSVSTGPVMVFRWNGNATSLTGYVIIPSPSLSELRFFSTVNGTSTSLGTTAATFVVGNSYTLDVEIDQTNGTTSTFTSTLTNNTTSTVIVNAATFTDTTASLQTPANSGVGLDATGNGTAVTVTGFQYFTDQTVNAVPAATAYSVTLATTGVEGVPQSGTVSTTGISLTSTLSVAFTAAGTITPNPVTITNGQQTASFSYTPPASTSDTVAWTHTGGNSGMTGDGSQTQTNTAPITPLDANLFWTDGWLLSGTGAYANNAGNYLKMAFTGTSFVVNFDVTNIQDSSVTSTEWPTIRYVVDGAAPVDLQLATQGGNAYTLTLTSALSAATTHTFYMILRSETQAFNRWTPNASGFPPSGLRVSSFILSSTAATQSLAGTILALSASRAYVFGDSISEGSKTSFPLTPVFADAEATWTNAACRALGCEYTNYAFSGQAYSGQMGVPDVPFFGTAWPLRFAGQTKLSGGLFITNSGSSAPRFILVNMGTNDAANNASKTVGSVQAVLTAVQAAAPSATMILVMPFAFNQPYFSAQGYAAFLLSEYNAFVAANPTAKIVSLGAFAGVGLGAYPASGTSDPISADQLHPSGQRSANLGALVGATVINATTTAGGLPQFRNGFPI